MKEFYDVVSAYGMGTIIRHYAGYPHALPLPVAIQHGWTMVPKRVDARADAPENWYWSAAAEQLYRTAYPTLTTRTVGAPFLYLLKRLAYKPMPPAAQKGSIVFPSHSTPSIEIVCDFDEYAALLAELPAAYHPITVCLYYVDRDRGLDEPFLRRGFPVVTNGANRYAANFLGNFVRNVHGKRFIFSNQLTSALLFAAAMGLTAYLWGPEFKVIHHRSPTKSDDHNQNWRTWEARYQDIFRFPETDLSLQKAVVEEELGQARMLTPQQMRKLLWQLTYHPTYLRQFPKQWISHLRQTRAWQQARQMRGKLCR